MHILISQNRAFGSAILWQIFIGFMLTLIPGQMLLANLISLRINSLDDFLLISNSSTFCSSTFCSWTFWCWSKADKVWLDWFRNINEIEVHYFQNFSWNVELDCYDLCVIINSACAQFHDFLAVCFFLCHRYHHSMLKTRAWLFGIYCWKICIYCCLVIQVVFIVLITKLLPKSLCQSCWWIMMKQGMVLFKKTLFFFLPISFQNSWVKMLNMVLLPILEKVWYNLQHFCKFCFSSKFLDLGTTCFILLGLVVCSTMFLLQVIFQGQDFALILELEIHCLNALPIIVRFCFGTWMHSMEILFYGKEYFDITVFY